MPECGHDALSRASLDAYNDASPVVVRQFDLARPEGRVTPTGAEPDDTILQTNSMTGQGCHLRRSIDNVPQDEPRFAPVLDEAEAVVPAMSALAGQQRLRNGSSTQDHYAQARLRRQPASRCSSSSRTPPGMNFSGPERPLGRLRHAEPLRSQACPRLTGPIGGRHRQDRQRHGRLQPPVSSSPASSAKLFGLVAVARAAERHRLRPEQVPDVRHADARHRVPTLTQDLERLRNGRDLDLEAQGGALGRRTATTAEDGRRRRCSPASATCSTATRPGDRRRTSAATSTRSPTDLQPLVDAVEQRAGRGAAERRRKDSSPGSCTASRISSTTRPHVARSDRARRSSQFAQGLEAARGRHRPARLVDRTSKPWPVSARLPADDAHLQAARPERNRSKLDARGRAPSADEGRASRRPRSCRARSRRSTCGSSRRRSS